MVCLLHRHCLFLHLSLNQEITVQVLLVQGYVWRVAQEAAKVNVGEVVKVIVLEVVIHLALPHAKCNAQVHVVRSVRVDVQDSVHLTVCTNAKQYVKVPALEHVYFRVELVVDKAVVEAVATHVVVHVAPIVVGHVKEHAVMDVLEDVLEAVRFPYMTHFKHISRDTIL